jgi:hypothetical protein
MGSGDFASLPVELDRRDEDAVRRQFEDVLDHGLVAEPPQFMGRGALDIAA